VISVVKLLIRGDKIIPSLWGDLLTRRVNLLQVYYLANEFSYARKFKSQRLSIRQNVQRTSDSCPSLSLFFANATILPSIICFDILSIETNPADFSSASPGRNVF
jgi:hypothetical protein